MNTKIIILVDCEFENFEQMIEVVNDKNIFIVNTEQCDALHEYQHLVNSIKDFSKTDAEIMLSKFSGRESVVKELGDECSEMIFSLSSNKNSQYFSDAPVDMFLEIIKMFEKETI